MKIPDGCGCRGFFVFAIFTTINSGKDVEFWEIKIILYLIAQNRWIYNFLMAEIFCAEIFMSIIKKRQKNEY